MFAPRFTLSLLLGLLAFHGHAQEDSMAVPPPELDPGSVDVPPTEAYFITVEQMPEFPGGQEAMMTYLTRNMKYPEAEMEAGVEGRVFVGFVVDEEGNISDVTILRGVPEGPGLSAEALRVVKAMPKWKPGRQAGKPVKVKMTQPISFKLR